MISTLWCKAVHHLRVPVTCPSNSWVEVSTSTTQLECSANAMLRMQHVHLAQQQVANCLARFFIGWLHKKICVVPLLEDGTLGRTTTFQGGLRDSALDNECKDF
jgi:hypothetical protein